MKWHANGTLSKSKLSKLGSPHNPKEVKVKAKPAKTIVKAFPVADLKKAVH